MIDRRGFLVRAGGSVAALGAARGSEMSRIDRAAVVRRHNPVVRRFGPFSALSVGNGTFAFTVDTTGLQTFAGRCAKDFPLCTMSRWCWHSAPVPPEAASADSRLLYDDYETYGRKVPYLTRRNGAEPLYSHRRENPHRLHLGRTALDLTHGDGTPALPADITDIHQTLEMMAAGWTGGPADPLPGSPTDSHWKVRAEGLRTDDQKDERCG